MSMQHQYWVTKKSVLRKLGGKEDDCIVSSDAELDAKLELFKSLNDSCLQLQRVIEIYTERLCFLAQEENALGRYLKECGKNEKNASAGQLMSTAGKALAYTGHQRLTIRSPLVRLQHEVETFRCRAVTDTRFTVSEMEKVRTEYRAALSWMKSVSSQLDPDSGQGLERFRKAQSYVKQGKTKFDKFTLACLQKVDLLAAARCNMFSHALVPYQTALKEFESNAAETLSTAAEKLSKIEAPYNCNVVPELNEVDKDKSTFFNAEYTDNPVNKDENKFDDTVTENPIQLSECSQMSNDLIGAEFSPPVPVPPTPVDTTPDQGKPSSALLDLNWSSGTNHNADILYGNFLPSNLIQEGVLNFDSLIKNNESNQNSCSVNENDQCNNTVTATGINSGTSYKNDTQMSWLSLFSELDPLANCVTDNNMSGDRA